MDWKLMASTFALVFLAELGDKTQLAAFSIAAKSRKPWEVFAAASTALVVVTALGVAFGDVIRRVVPEKAMAIVSAVLFIGIGVWLLVKELWLEK